MKTPTLSEIVVVIPARNEEELLGGCLASIAASAAAAEVRVRTFVVLDRCVDDSRGVVARFPGVAALSTSGASVGAARALGIAHALASTPFPLRTVWLANTDADSIVPVDWIAEHARVARDGADAYVGAVVPVLTQLDEARARAWRTTHSPGSTLGHVHGANLGIRASAYRYVGGFPSLDVAEDVELVERLRRGGFDIRESENTPVVTSSRLVGRAPRGYADYLKRLVADGGPAGLGIE